MSKETVDVYLRDQHVIVEYSAIPDDGTLHELQDPNIYKQAHQIILNKLSLPAVISTILGDYEMHRTVNVDNEEDLEGLRKFLIDEGYQSTSDVTSMKSLIAKIFQAVREGRLSFSYRRG